MERGGESSAPVPVPNRGSANVLCRIAGAGEDGVRYQSRGPPLSVWTRNGHQHRFTGVRRGKNQSAKELADSPRRLASRAYHSNDYASQEKAALHARAG